MTSASRHPLSWAPPFLVGLVAAVAAEISVGLLLYSGPGLLRSLTVVLATLLAALALGLWTAPAAHRPDLVELIRRRWLVALVAFTLAAVAAGAWSVLGGLASGAATRGVGLAFLAGLPLYAVGSVLGGVAAAADGRPGRVAASAAGGAAVGAVFTSAVLVPNLVPASIFLFCLIAISGGALLHGRTLDDREEAVRVDEEESPFGRVVVHDRRGASREADVRELLVEGRVRGGTSGGDEPLRAWEAVALEALGGGATDPGPVLVAGAGCAVLIRGLVESGSPVTVVDRNPVVYRMAVRHLGAPPDEGAVSFEARNALDELLGGGDRLRAVVVDASLFGETLPLLPERVGAALRERLRPGGLVLVGADRAGPLLQGRGREAVERLAAAGKWRGTALYRTGEAEGRGGALLVLAAREEELPPTPAGAVRLDSRPPAEAVP